MRKQIPLAQDFYGYNNVGGTTTNFDVSQYHFIKNGVLINNQSAQLDNSYKLTLKQRPSLWATSNWTNSLSFAPAGTRPQAVAFADSPSGGVTQLFVFSDGTLAGTTFTDADGTALAKPAGWTSATKNYSICQLGAAVGGLYGGYEWFVNTPTEGLVSTTLGVLTEVTDADYTSWASKTPAVAMDGYIFQGSNYDCKIYNSDQNNPLSWTATGFVQANQVPGILMNLVRVKNFLAAFKSQSIEFFKNAGNPSPGSPLEALPELTMRYGCCGAFLISQSKEGIIWLGTDAAGTVGLFMMNTETLQVTRLSTPSVEHLLTDSYARPEFVTDPNNGSTNIINILDLFGDPGRVDLSVFRAWGKELVMFPFLIANGSNIGTFVYDLELKVWYVWTCVYNGTEIAFPWRTWNSSGYFTFVYSSQIGTYPRLLFTDGYNFGDFRDKEDGTTQTGSSIELMVATSPMDFGTFRRKFMSSLEVRFGLAYGTSAGSGTISMYYYDDDGETPCSTRSMSTSIGAGRVIFRRLGSFRKRRFVISHSGKEEITLNLMETDLTVSDDDID